MANTTSSGSTDSTATPPRPRPSVIPETAVLNIPIKDGPPEGDTTTNEEATEEDEAEEGRKDSEEALHPEWLDEIRFMSYRTAAKLRLLQKRTGLVQIDIWNMIEAFRENGLNVADTEARITRPRLETLVGSLYASLSKRLPSSEHHGSTVGTGGTRPKLESMASWLLSWLLTALNPSQNDKNLQLKIRTLKTSLAVLCSGKLMDKLRYVYSLISDENGHMVHAKYASFVRDVVRIPRAVGEEFKVGPGLGPGGGGATSPFEPGTLVTLNDFLEALMSDPGPQCLSWLPVLHRIVAAESVVHQGISCGSCGAQGFRGLRYKSDKSKNFHLCQWCFWRGRIPIDHRDDVFKEFNTFSKSSLAGSSYPSGSLKKSLQCLTGGGGKSKPPKFPEMETPLDLGGMVQHPSPLPSVRSLPRKPPPYQAGQPDPDFPTYGNLHHQQQVFYPAPQAYPEVVNEHHLIAQYAQEIAQQQHHQGSSVGGSTAGSFIHTAPDPKHPGSGHMVQQSRELVYELEKKNQEIMHDIERLRKSSNPSGGGNRKPVMHELQGLRSHKMELESRLEELQCARKDLMEELDELVKLLKVQPVAAQAAAAAVAAAPAVHHHQQQHYQSQQQHYQPQRQPYQQPQQQQQHYQQFAVQPHMQQHFPQVPVTTAQQQFLEVINPDPEAETNHSYTNIAGLVGIEPSSEYPVYEVPYQDQQQHDSFYTQQQQQPVYYEPQYSEVSRPPVIGDDSSSPRTKKHSKKQSMKKLEKSKAVEEYDSEVAAVTAAAEKEQQPVPRERNASVESMSD